MVSAALFIVGFVGLALFWVFTLAIGVATEKGDHKGIRFMLWMTSFAASVAVTCLCLSGYFWGAV